MTQWEKEKKEIIRIDNERKLAPRKRRKRSDDVRDEESRITDPEYPDGPVTTRSKRSIAKRKRRREEVMREDQERSWVSREKTWRRNRMCEVVMKSTVVGAYVALFYVLLPPDRPSSYKIMSSKRISSL